MKPSPLLMRWRQLFGWHRREVLRRRLGGKQEMCWVRTISDDACRHLVRDLPYKDMSALEISGKTWREWAFKSYKTVNYPDYDICDKPLQETFDLIIAEHVFEHLLWPYRAARNVYSMLSGGGYFLICTPFLVPIHEHPVDCSRWTERGLRYFLAESGFELKDIQTGSWGNRRCVIANLNQFLYYRQNIHSLKNEARFPVSVWAIAQKASRC